MNKRLKLFYFLLIITLFCNQLHAQETFINNVNMGYLDKLVATAKRNYPEVKVRQSQVNAAHSTYTATKFAWFDGLTASYIYSPQNSINLATPTIFKGYQLAISLSIGQLLKTPATTNAAYETYKVAQYQQSEYMLSLEAQVKRFYFAYLEAMAELRLRSGAVSDASAAVKQLKYSFQKGETTFQIYNEQLNSYYNQNSFMVQAELATWTAKTNLEELLGTKLEDIK
ncbi:Outer membrane efflux protein [Mucilaginibacter pineti]|uniref:Outer membrane efflux protein n=1 Tax=Mucilaginibacter pineti TaxID=1391627 RepID=A0A1G6TTK0_9SPHI|nr:TolC family protein [Mucilaginibacter pineti]SDD31776.1 Outer membrane efflux protein [Mucilaginibacter pineti]